MNHDAGGCVKRWGGARVHSWHDPIGEIGRNAATSIPAAKLTVHNSGQAMCNGRVTAQYSITTIFLAYTRGNTH